jgi:hypothetical protein
MTSNRLRYSIALIVTAALTPRTSVAQAWRPDSTRCAEASDSLRVGSIEGDRQLRELAISGACGNTSAISAALDRRRGLPYSYRLGWFFGAVPVDTAIHQWFIQTAMDPSAGLPARVLSLLTLMRYSYAGAYANYDSVIVTPEGGICPVNPSDHGGDSPPMPVSLRTQSLTTADGIVNDASTPLPVRSAANCLGNAIRMTAGWGMRTMSPVSVPAVTLAYLCGNTFRLRNGNDQSLILRFEVVGANEAFEFRVAPRNAGSPYREELFLTKNAGPVRMLLDDVPLQTVANGNLPECQGGRSP